MLPDAVGAAEGTLALLALGAGCAEVGELLDAVDVPVEGELELVVVTVSGSTYC